MSTIKLKICGVKSVDEARQLRESGVDLVGLNFIPGSSRFISLEAADEIMAELKSSSIQTVALFAGRPLDEVDDYASRLDVDYIQLHGNEPAEYAKGVNATVIRAIAVDSNQTAQELIKFMQGFPADYFMLDRQRQGQGSIVDLELAAEVISALPDKIFLAGGLNADNLVEVLARVRPYGIDIASGVRDANDGLDIIKVRQCQEILRGLGD